MVVGLGGKMWLKKVVLYKKIEKKKETENKFRRKTENLKSVRQYKT